MHVRDSRLITISHEPRAPKALSKETTFLFRWTFGTHFFLKKLGGSATKIGADEKKIRGEKCVHCFENWSTLQPRRIFSSPRGKNLKWRINQAPAFCFSRIYHRLWTETRITLSISKFTSSWALSFLCSKEMNLNVYVKEAKASSKICSKRDVGLIK